MKIKKNENLFVILATNHRTTLKKYVWIVITCQEVKIYMKIYVCSIIVYDLLLELKWQKRVQMKIDMRQKIMSIKNEWKRENDSNSIHFKEDINSDIDRKNKKKRRFRWRRDLASNHRWRNEREVKKKTLTNEAICQNDDSETIKKKKSTFPKT